MLLGYMPLLTLLMLDDDDPLFSASKNVSRWCFLCRFSVYCFKVGVADCFEFDSKDDVPFKGVSLHIFDSICVCQILLILTLRHVYLRRKVLNLKIVDESPKFKKSRLSWRNHDYLEKILIVFRKRWSCSYVLPRQTYV